MDALKQAVRAYVGLYGDAEGFARTQVPGLMMKFSETPQGRQHSVYRPLLLLVLQGAKRIAVGREDRIVSAGQSVIVTTDMPVIGRIVQASRDVPYLAIAIELEMTILREVAAQLGGAAAHGPSAAHLFAEDTEAAALDCLTRLVRLLDRPEAIALLRPGLMRELNYWLLSGPHGAAMRAIADPGNHANRLAAAIAVLSAEYRSRIPVERLASAAAMSLTAFHKHFKHMTSLTPGQYQKRLRLIEARRLMMDEGFSASRAAFEVGYESISQFTREYGRLFQAPPKRDALRARTGAIVLNERARDIATTEAAHHASLSPQVWDEPRGPTSEAASPG